MDPAHTRHHELDLYRVVAIWVVVIGHWFVVAVTDTDGELDGTNAVGELWWAPPVSWIMQVMAVFFAVGGYANAVSYRRHLAEGGDGLGWVLRRFRRLLLPAAALLVVLTATVAIATAGGADAELAGTGAWVATVPLWFLAVYAAAIAVTPIAVRADERLGLAVPVALASWVAIVDVVRFGAENLGPAESTYLVAWLAVHQLGIAWSSGRLGDRTHTGVLLAVGGVATAVVLVAIGPYPPLMVSAPGEVANTEPPTLVLVAFAAGQVGLLVALRPAARRWMVASARARARVERIQGVVLTVFLWHMTAAVVAIVALYGTGLVPTDPIGSPAWLAWRVPWLAACGVLLAAFTATFGWLDRLVQRPSPPKRAFAPVPALLGVTGIVACLVGAVGIALAGSGSHGALGLPTWAVIDFLVGVALVHAALRSADRRNGGAH